MQSSQTLELLRDAVAKIVSATGEIDEDMSVSALGIDSLNAAELIVACQEIYLDVADFESLSIDEYTTLREIDTQMNELSSRRRF